MVAREMASKSWQSSIWPSNCVRNASPTISSESGPFAKSMSHMA